MLVLLLLKLLRVCKRPSCIFSLFLSMFTVLTRARAVLVRVRVYARCTLACYSNHFAMI